MASHASPLFGCSATARRGEGEGAILCLFNLSADPHELRVTGAGVPVGPSVGAAVKGDRLTLTPHAAAFLPVTGNLTVSEEVSTVDKT